MRWPEDKPVALDSIMISDSTVSCACPFCGSINEFTFESEFFSEPDYKSETITCWDCSKDFVLPNILFDDIDAYGDDIADDDDDSADDLVHESDFDDLLDDDIDYFEMWEDFDPEDEEG